MKTAVSYQAIDDLPEHLIPPLLQFWLAYADTKHRLGIQCSHWVTGTPALEGAVGSAALTQDELGHARTLYGILRRFPNAPMSIGADHDLEARDVYYAPSSLTPRWAHWIDVVAFNITLDRGLQMVMETAVDSTFTFIAGCSQKLLQEERFHRIFGDTWLEKLTASSDPRLLAQLQDSIHHAAQITQQWFGPPDDPALAVMIEHGILKPSASSLYLRWHEEVSALLIKSDLQLPMPVINWEAWNPDFRELYP